MHTQTATTGSARKHSDGLMGRIIVGVCVLAILGICLVAGSYMQNTLDRLRSTHQTFNDRQLRNGYVAMSDVQRLVLILQEAVAQGEMTADAEAEFRSAADFLYVRTDNFRRVLDSDTDVESALIAIDELEKIQVVVDDALQDGFADLPALSMQLTAMSQVARQALVAYLDDMRRLQDRLLLSQSIAVENQRKVVLWTLAAMSFLGIVAVLLLRQDVMSRHARRAAEDRVRHLAFYDPLTGLPNRVHFQDRLALLLEKRATVALLLVDMDGFKLINDTHGHAAGDAMLCHVSGVLNRISHAHGGFAARLGGDEFAVFLESDNLPELTRICEDLIVQVAQPVSFEGKSLAVDVSIGMAMNTQIGEQIAISVDSLSRVADFALYASKSNGKRQFTVYDETLEQQFLEHRAMVEELPRAIADGSMGFVLQPKVRLATEQIYGFEALVRWQRGGQVVGPDAFIAIAEESGLITDIDYCVLRQACTYLADFNRENGTQLSVSVNFSTLHFNSSKFVKVVEQTLRDTALPPALLTIEITETVEMQDWDRATRIIAAMHELGVRISIDDFGAGFSSLAYLRTTVADEIKIDRSLVEDIETSNTSRFLLDSVLDIARNLDLEVTVEGIETRAQADIIAAMGATNAQGFFFGRPMLKEDATSKATAQQQTGIARVAS